MKLDLKRVMIDFEFVKALLIVYKQCGERKKFFSSIKLNDYLLLRKSIFKE